MVEKILNIIDGNIPIEHFDKNHNVLPEELLAVAFAHGTETVITKVCEHVKEKLELKFFYETKL